MFNDACDACVVIKLLSNVYYECHDYTYIAYKNADLLYENRQTQAQL